VFLRPLLEATGSGHKRNSDLRERLLTDLTVFVRMKCEHSAWCVLFIIWKLRK